MEKVKGFQKLENIVPDEINTGWDEKAIEYALLPDNNRIFQLGKEMMYEVIEKDLFPDREHLDVLDFNCGCGNDFPFFLNKGWHLTGCDGASGMLNVAYDKYREWIEKGKLDLFLGQSENLDENSFEGRKFDLIFSTTGGFSYVDDEEFIREHKILLSMLKPGGKILAAHLTPFCLAESLYEIFHLRFEKARKRWKSNLKVKVKEKEYDMFLRSSSKIQNLLKEVVKIEKKYAILTLTPPYQTGFNPDIKIVEFQKKLEKIFLRSDFAANFSDQVAVLLSCKSQKANPK